MAYVLIIIGISGLLLSRSLTKRAWYRAGLTDDTPIEVLRATAGTGIVPKYISFINLASWLVLLLGIIKIVV